MTLRSLTCFSLWAAGPLVAASLTGSLQLIDSRESSVRKDKDYSGIAVWLEPLEAKPALPPSGTHTILQKGKRFIPHVSIIPLGTLVDLPNLDPIFHNAFSNFAGQPFDTGLYPPGGTQRIRFTREGVVRVFCNIHSNMSAVILVVNTRWYAVTGRDGAFKIDDVPPGGYRLKIWHERARQEVLGELERTVTIAAGGLNLPLIPISESGYLALPHKNKYGRDYPPEPAERPSYGGKRR
jgi:plastocyanin